MILRGGAFYPDAIGLSLYQSPAFDNVAVKIHDDTHYYMTSAEFDGVSEWHHLIISWKPLNLIYFYKNGCPTGIPVIDPRTHAVASWTTNFTIGGNRWGDAEEPWITY